VDHVRTKTNIQKQYRDHHRLPGGGLGPVVGLVLVPQLVLAMRVLRQTIGFVGCAKIDAEPLFVKPTDRASSVRFEWDVALRAKAYLAGNCSRAVAIAPLGDEITL
jgi:hypothetical protein